MLKVELGRGGRDRITLGFENAPQGANRAVGAVVRQQRTAHRAGSFGRGCRHRMLLATRILLDLVHDGSEKIARGRRVARGPYPDRLQPNGIYQRVVMTGTQRFQRKLLVCWSGGVVFPGLFRDSAGRCLATNLNAGNRP
jgi:hypothetical protein